MKSKFDRKTHFTRLGLSTGIGALAIITGACSESAGSDSDIVPANSGATEAASTDGEGSTDVTAAATASTDGEGSTDTEAPAASTDGEGSTDTEGSY